MRTTESYNKTETKLKRIAWLSGRDSEKEFSCLMHYFNEESLKECFNQLDKNKAVGIDKVTKSDYAKNLDKNIEELLSRMKRMAYRPSPVRQTMIPKAGGAMRPLGISNFEDKIIQKIIHVNLERVFEIFLKKISKIYRFFCREFYSTEKNKIIKK